MKFLKLIAVMANGSQHEIPRKQHQDFYYDFAISNKGDADNFIIKKEDGETLLLRNQVSEVLVTYMPGLDRVVDPNEIVDWEFDIAGHVTTVRVTEQEKLQCLQLKKLLEDDGFNPDSENTNPRIYLVESEIPKDVRNTLNKNDLVAAAQYYPTWRRDQISVQSGKGWRAKRYHLGELLVEEMVSEEADLAYQSMEERMKGKTKEQVLSEAEEICDLIPPVNREAYGSNPIRQATMFLYKNPSLFIREDDRKEASFNLGDDTNFTFSVTKEEEAILRKLEAVARLKTFKEVKEFAEEIHARNKEEGTYTEMGYWLEVAKQF